MMLAAGLVSSACTPSQEATNTNGAASNRPAVNSGEVTNEQAPGSPQNSTRRTVVDVDKDSLTGEPPAGVKPYEQPAPENSTYTSSLGTTALEVRTFKKHPQLAKVEKTIDGKNQTVKVFLKNGKVIDVAPEKLPNIATAGSAAILEAAGINSAQNAAPLPAAKANSTKKGETIP